eukprot:gene14079-5066_t
MAAHSRFTRLFLGVFLGLVAITGFVIYESLQCDFEDGLTYYKLPNGKLIKKFDPNQEIELFTTLSPKCDFENEKLVCPDVRHLGKTLLRQTQLATIRMMAAFDRICRKHRIRYWMWRGALLGAIRHEGFIPWDNELDIGIMKTDYEKFRIVSHELPVDIFLQNASSDHAFGKHKHTILAKLRDQQSCFGNCVRAGCKFHDGFMIDIFGFEEDANSFLRETTNNKVNFNVRKTDVFPLKEARFEGFSVFVPNHYKMILRKNYGSDYYEIPKIRKRCPPGQIVGLPWTTCQELNRMNSTEKNFHIYSTSISKVKSVSWYL